MNVAHHDEDIGSAALVDLLEPYRPLHVRYAAEELICRKGTFAAGLQWIAQGLVLETDRQDENGSLEPPPDLLSTGDVLGVELLVAGAEERHRTTCRALTEVSLIFLDRASLDRALERDLQLARVLVGHLAARYVRSRRARASSSLAPASRLAAMLLELSPLCEAARGGAESALPEAIDLRVLGQLCGLSPTRIRRLSAEVGGLRESSGRVVFRAETLRFGGSEPQSVSSIMER